ncbi:hypothetical protein JKP88DRAFT_243976 [Tribonema minus]|uniref:Uncharacterized protein n=1 Tax=Tribonema minus TaxID=303371 RepID=A0A835Z9R2_9STRA|nr:hypothetical protein JKP88DRAFT_243976 [Tribonema minus]
MSDSFDPACIAPVASFSAMITSLFFCFESDVWSCKTSAKLGSIASVSIVAFFAANALTRKLNFEGTKLHAVNSMVIVLPQILMSLAESAHCKDKKKHGAGDGMKMITLYGVPLIGYLLSTSSTAHSMACSFMATTGLDPAAVAKARARLEEAKKAASARFDAMRAKSSPAGDNNRNLPYWAKFKPPTPEGEPKVMTSHKTTVIPSKHYSRNRQELNRLTRNF